MADEVVQTCPECGGAGRQGAFVCRRCNGKCFVYLSTNREKSVSGYNPDTTGWPNWLKATIDD